MSGEKVKLLDWKARKSAQALDSKIKLNKCRKCNEVGHFAKYCLKDTSANDIVPDEVEISPFPTLMEAARMASNKSSAAPPSTKVSLYETNSPTNTNLTESSPSHSENKDSNSVGDNDNITVEVEPQSAQSNQEENDVYSEEESQAVDPVFSAGGSEEHETQILQDCLKKFGYSSFRPGQHEAVLRTLRGQSTLVILSTGTGKSLCYQLPAYLYAKAHPGALTLCISPLVSLMENQCASTPSFLKVACLHTMLTATKKEEVLEKVRKQKLHILLVSPEAICSGLFGLLRDIENFPPISFACIDEVHCVSEWSHNFRPSYLRLCKILRDKLKVPAILGLTATATNRTSKSICDQLRICPDTIIRGEIIPVNLNLSVSRDSERDEALLYLLSNGRFKTCDSIIIYCTRRDECVRVAALIRTRLQDLSFAVSKQNSRRRISHNCEAYHAGMSGAHRRLVQNLFMSGEIRVVVATIAFGMGIDKSDIRAVIHYNMPRTFESYVQEIGRAGRDGLPAHCHLFMDCVQDKDFDELKRRVESNSVNRSTIRKLVAKVFRPCKCSKIESLKNNTKKIDSEKQKSDKKPCPGHEVSFSVADTVDELELSEENIDTLLCYLELDTSRKWIESLPKCYQTCKIQSYGGLRLLKMAAQESPALAVAVAIQKEKRRYKEEDTYLQFNIIEVAATVGWNSAVVRRELKQLEWTPTEFDENGKPKKFRKSGLIVEFSDLAHRMISPGLTEDEGDQVLDLLHGRNVEQIRTQLYQLQRVHNALRSVSTQTAMKKDAEFSQEKSEMLKKFIRFYFQDETLTFTQFPGPSRRADESEQSGEPLQTQTIEPVE